MGQVLMMPQGVAPPRHTGALPAIAQTAWMARDRDTGALVFGSAAPHPFEAEARACADGRLGVTVEAVTIVSDRLFVAGSVLAQSNDDLRAALRRLERAVAMLPQAAVMAVPARERDELLQARLDARGALAVSQ